MNNNPLENTDKYYKSKKPGSPMSHSAADSRRKPGQKTPAPGVSPVATPLFNKDDTTTDKYYATGGSKPMAGQPARPQAAPKRELPPGTTLNDLIVVEIEKAADVGAGVAMAKVHAARGGRVEIAVAEKDLVAKVTVALDGAVSREEITEDQRRAILVGARRSAATGHPLPAPAPAPFDPSAFLSAAPAARKDEPLDVDAFLAGGAVDDEDEKLAALTGGGTDGSRPPEPEPTPEPEPEDNDFLADERPTLPDIKPALLTQPLLSPEDGPAVGTTPSPETLAGG